VGLWGGYRPPLRSPPRFAEKKGAKPGDTNVPPASPGFLLRLVFCFAWFFASPPPAERGGGLRPHPFFFALLHSQKGVQRSGGAIAPSRLSSPALLINPFRNRVKPYRVWNDKCGSLAPLTESNLIGAKSGGR
jgi:hypothetical protein